MIEAHEVSKRFIKQPDLAQRMANKLGGHYQTTTVHAVDSVSLKHAKGEVVGLVGESGCGKSTLGRMIAGIMPPSEGNIRVMNHDESHSDPAEAKRLSLAVQMIFQDPFASLNPRMRIAEIIGEAPRLHGIVDGRGQADYVAQMMARVGLDPAFAKRYPHQFSGGQRQRIGIARALAVNPQYLVCDEAIAALDVSIQAQVINLFMDLRSEFDLTYLFISHDLGVVEHISDRILIMYLGRIVEAAPVEQLFEQPLHPYAQALLDEVPRIATGKRKFTPVKGEIPSPLDPPKGCHFHPRCPHALARCSEEKPMLREVAPGRLAACHLHDQH